jgi:glucokinase
MRVLAGDVGGTHARFVVRDVDAREASFARTYSSAAFSSLDDILVRFLRDAAEEGDVDSAPERACIGVAGVVHDEVCRTANLPWTVDRRRLAERTGIDRLALVNDFEALASAVPTLGADDVVVFGGRSREERGPIAVVGAGTGLGQAFLLWSEAGASYRVVPSEGGHADFAPRSPLETALLRYLTQRHGRVSQERVLSGPGLADTFEFLRSEEALGSLVRSETLTRMATEDPAAVVTSQASERRDPVCEAALGIFASVLGAVAGNLALTVLATGGVFVGGGIAPRIVDFLRRSPFRSSFEQKGRRRELLERIPLSVIVHPEPGLAGAAAIASRL